eukprot:g1975.t1
MELRYNRLHGWIVTAILLTYMSSYYFSPLQRVPGGDEMTIAADSMDDEEFGIVIDAGSSGTRLHLYRRRDDTLVEIFKKKIYPGISSFATRRNFDDLETDLARLIASADVFVPPRRRGATSVHLYATAGMRLLSDIDRLDVMNSCKRVLRASAYAFDDDAGARTISGREEAVFDWLSVNLAAKLLPLKRDVVQLSTLAGVADLGGASSQIAFLVGEDTDISAGDGSVRDIWLPISGKELFRARVRLYAKSRLGFGMYEAYKSVAAATSTTSPFPCDFEGDFDACVRLVSAFVRNFDRERTSPRPHPSMLVYGIDNFGKMSRILRTFADAPVDSVSMPTENYAVFDVDTFLGGVDAQGRLLCAAKWAVVRERVPWEQERRLRHSCFGVAYVYVLSTELYGLRGRSKDAAVGDTRYPTVRFANTIGESDASWAMGAMYAAFSGLGV